MGISAGLLNERIRVLKEIHVVSEYGDQDIQYKEKFWCRARHLDKEGTRTEVNNEIFYTNNKQFEVRIYQDIKDTDIIQFYDQFYRIINISPDRPNQRKIITVEIINSFDFPIDVKPIEDEVIPTPDPEPDPDFTPESGRTFVYHGLEYYITDGSESWCFVSDGYPDSYYNGEPYYQVIVVAANMDDNFPGLSYSGNIVIPGRFEYNGHNMKVIGISDNAFNGTDIISVVIPDTVKSVRVKVPPLDLEINYGAFDNTYSLVSMKIYGHINWIHIKGLFGSYTWNEEVRSTIKVVYVEEEFVDEYQMMFASITWEVPMDLSYLIQPIQN